LLLAELSTNAWSVAVSFALQHCQDIRSFSNENELSIGDTDDSQCYIWNLWVCPIWRRQNWLEPDGGPTAASWVWNELKSQTNVGCVISKCSFCDCLQAALPIS
jgi:hypothetical protein